jgi:ribosomal protein L40E
VKVDKKSRKHARRQIRSSVASARVDDAEIVRVRFERALACLAPADPLPPGAVAADPSCLSHNHATLLPYFYLDIDFVCRDCGAREVWTAAQQKWWYEEAKGPIDSTAARCRACRLKERARVTEARLRAGHGVKPKA